MGAPMRLDKRVRGQANLEASAQKTQYLAFDLNGEAFAMDIRCIKEVIQYGALTAVPLMPDFIRGVINLRGAVVPVVDLSVRFGRTPTDVARRTCVVILEVPSEGGTVELGILVDNVSEVLDIAEADIEPAPAFGSALRSEFIAGVGKVGGRFVILLDVAHVLSIEEMTALASSCAPTEIG
ncbi:chemotaxis protein CheW [Mesoterricola sediminis]|uniref:Chemotaxis protein CheW n=1 Tax=Mesoterricola sediminis TaxID=2927980 RepID=A0AA48KB84_9BACT|nr:chemotaxis protein CheW [Mesoterricola sediminis]BDU75531.1 chemotaxis protein CheW [Mesoterricola sediminis]